MKTNLKKKISVLIVAIIILTLGIAATILLLNGKQKYTVRSYSNYQLGFTIKVPAKVKSKQGNIETNPLVPLNVYEEKDSVYFSTDTLENTLKNSSWDLKITGSKMKKRDFIVPYLESVYGVKGCTMEMNKLEGKDDFYSIILLAKEETLSPDDPNACFIAGKVRSMYHSKSKKLITLQTIEPFFYLEKGPVSEEVLETLEFMPELRY